MSTDNTPLTEREQKELFNALRLAEIKRAWKEGSEMSDIQIAMAAIQQAQRDLAEAEKRLRELQDLCQHNIVNNATEYPSGGEGVCTECGYKTDSWFCPDNPPTHTCEYTKGEWCIHCGAPEERL